MMLQFLMVLHCLQCLYPLVGSIDNIARLASISKMQQDLFIESSGKWERNYVGLTEVVMGSTKYLVTTSLTTNRTYLLYLFNDLESFISNRSTHLPIELKVKNDSSDHVLKPFQEANSLRLFNVGSHLYVMYATSVQQFAKLTVLDGIIFFQHQDVVVVDASNELVPKECRYTLNHWIPILNPTERKGYVNFMFICSIYPHRILPLMYQKMRQNENTNQEVRVVFDAQDLDMQTVLFHETNAEFFIQLWWPYGYPECGTTPTLIDTPYGPRFLSFFWSVTDTIGTNNMIFFGAYLFENYPTLRITHFSMDPVLLPSFHSHKMVPTESKMINGTIFVMLKDRQGSKSYWIQLKTNEFLKSLREASSVKLSDNSDKKLEIIKRYNAKMKKGYYEIQFLLMDIRKRQYKTFLIDDWDLVGIPRNPSMVHFNGSFLVTSCLCNNKVRWGSFECSYQQYSQLLSRHDTISFNHTLNKIYHEHTNLALMAEDMRLIIINETRLFGIFSVHRPRKHHQRYHFDQYMTELQFKNTHLVVAKESIMMNVSYESSLVSQKNWIPFACNVSMSGLCFVQTIQPHAIVTFNQENFYQSTVGINNMMIIAQSSYTPSNVWTFGELRGGSQAELVNTPYGPRYFAMFHSSQERGEEKKGKLKGVKTYYAGGYLFRVGYPYDITHMSTEPFVPSLFYNISQSWPHRGMDFVVFPMSLIIRERIAYVSMGYQDRAGSIVSFKLDPFFLSMKAVSSRITS